MGLTFQVPSLERNSETEKRERQTEIKKQKVPLSGIPLFFFIDAGKKSILLSLKPSPW